MFLKGREMNFKSGFRKLGFFVLLLCLFSLILSSDSDRNDLLIKNTKIVDGTGKAAYKGNIAIKGDKIVRVGKFKGEADVVIDGSGLVTCPGFIDPHLHADGNIMKYPSAENLIMQGITTVVGGQCGNSPAPRKNLTFGQFISNLEKKGISINFALLVGHNVIRSLVMGDDFKREATREEMEKMKKYVEDAMQNGSFGLSAGFDYFPGEYAGEEEIVEVAKIAGKHGGLFVPHWRHRNSHWPGDVEEWKYGVYHGPVEDVWVGRYRGLWEAIEISKKAQVPLHIAHLCNIYRIPQPHPNFLEKAAAEATI